MSPLWLVVLGFLLYQMIHFGGSWSAWFAAGSGALAVVLNGYQAFFYRFGNKEIAVNYGLDPGHCGRCGYDLTGNVSGVCPECGWRLPGPDHVWERPLEYVRLRPWRIPYLYNWRWGLFGTVLLSGALLFWVVVASTRGYWHFVAVVGALAVLPMIQAIRVAGYGLRHRRGSARESAEV
ncbi:MAG: hypothetical protein JXQ73_08690 [Phycisphaerae bacterium]|nr:hypothetical protein [Phycisphaerae bacterium]